MYWPSVISFVRMWVRAVPAHGRADETHEQRHGQLHHRLRGQRAQHVVEQPLHALGEHAALALFRVVALHGAHGAERLGEPACTSAPDLPRSRNTGRMTLNARPSTTVNPTSTAAVTSVMVALILSRKTSETAAVTRPPMNSTKPVPTVPDAFDVAHDPRHERAGLVRVVERDGQPADVRLHLARAARRSRAGLPWRAAASAHYGVTAWIAVAASRPSTSSGSSSGLRGVMMRSIQHHRRAARGP